MSIGGTNVGGIYYDVTLETRGLVNGQREVDRRLGSMERRGEAFAARMTAVASAVKVLAVAMASVKLAQTADDFRMLQARVNVATQSITAGAEAFGKLRDISTRTRSALADNVTIFARLNPSIVQMGGNANDTLRVVELLGKAITVSGASAAEKSSALLQFGQALGSGKLAGDELRSLLESAPYLMKQLADGLGVPIGQLKSLGEQGKLTADVVVEALGKSAERINKDFASFPITLAGAFTVARDSLTRLSERLDSFMGSSTMLTGVVSGIGKAVSGLADVFDRLGGAADATAKKDNIKAWANSTATVLSYVVDAADFVTRGFQQVGTGLGGLAASAAILAEGKLSTALATLGQTWRDVQAIGSRPFAGAQMRQGWAAGDGAVAPPDGPMTRLKPAGGTNSEEARRNAARRASAQAYYEGLLADTRSGLAKIDAEEAKALQDNARRAAADVDNAGIYARAKTLIVEKYARERALLQEQYAREAAAAEIAIVTDEQERILKIREEAFRAADADVRLGVKTVEQAEQAKRVAAFQFGLAMVDAADRAAQAEFEMHLAMTENAEERIALIERETVRAAELAFAMGRITEAELAAARARASQQSAGSLRDLDRQRDDVRMDTLQTRASAGGVEDQVAVVRAEAERRIQASLEAQQRDLANAQLYADQRVAIEEEMYRRIAEMRESANQAAYSSMANGLGQLTEALRSETGKQDALYKAAFVAQKAYAIASSIVAIQSGVAKAADAPWPLNIAAMAQVAAATASIIATIKSANYGGGRQFGGPVSAGTMYRVNESGRPEMFTAANGAQYMLPTRDGRVTSADRVAGEAGGGRGQARPIQVVQHFTINGGPADLRTQQQIAAAAARGLQAASMRNN